MTETNTLLIVRDVYHKFQSREGKRTSLSKELLRKYQFNPILTWYLKSQNLLPSGVIGSDWDACLHHGVTSLDESCGQMSIFERFASELTPKFMEDVKAGLYGQDGQPISKTDTKVRPGSLKAILNVISNRFLGRDVTDEEFQEFDRHQTANQLSDNIQDQATMTLETYQHLQKLLKKYRVYILTNNRLPILQAFLENTKVLNPNKSTFAKGLEFGPRLTFVAKDSQYYPSWQPDPSETVQELQTREMRHEKPNTHNMTMALARNFKQYKETLSSDIILEVICNILNINRADLMRYLLVRISHMERLFIGDSDSSDGGLVTNFNARYLDNCPHSDPSRTVPPTRFTKVQVRHNNLAQRVH